MFDSLIRQCVLPENEYEENRIIYFLYKSLENNELIQISIKRF